MSPAGNHNPETATASIDDAAGGGWLVTTETGSRYELDLDRRTLRRNPGGGRLRRDGHTVTLHQIVECRVGASAGFLICVEPGVLTLRLTSHVTRICSQTTDPEREVCPTSSRSQRPGDLEAPDGRRYDGTTDYSP